MRDAPIFKETFSDRFSQRLFGIGIRRDLRLFEKSLKRKEVT